MKPPPAVSLVDQTQPLRLMQKTFTESYLFEQLSYAEVDALDPAARPRLKMGIARKYWLGDDDLIYATTARLFVYDGVEWRHVVTGNEYRPVKTLKQYFFCSFGA